MAYNRKIVLHCLEGYKPELDEMIEQFIVDGVVFIGVVGNDCDKAEDIVDELVIADGDERRPFILTSAHPNESLDDAIEFANSLSEEYSGSVQIVEL